MMENTINEKVVLVVDDLFENLLILKRMLEKCGYVPMTASSGKDALEMIKMKMPELVLLDIYMPEMDGFELCETLKNDVNTHDIPVIFISSGMSKEDKVRGFQLGAVDFINKPFELEEVSLRVNNHVRMYEMQRDAKAYNKRLNKMVQDHVIKIKEEQRNTLLSLEKIFFFHFPEEEKRIKNLARNCRFLAQALEFSDKFESLINQTFIDSIEEAAMLHDIGRLAAIDNNDEKGCHEEVGAKFLEELSFLSEHNYLLALAIEAARSHSELWNGDGKPLGLMSEQIPLVGRIVSVCVAFEKACEDFKKQNNSADLNQIREFATSYITQRAGIDFDPDITKVFGQVSRQFSITE
ncbi:MAG: response regulator [Lachnospiraceae bacterium]|nr:response regulator [Lachnospiraceae bacterium]